MHEMYATNWQLTEIQCGVAPTGPQHGGGTRRLGVRGELLLACNVSLHARLNVAAAVEELLLEA